MWIHRLIWGFAGRICRLIRNAHLYYWAASELRARLRSFNHWFKFLADIYVGRASWSDSSLAVIFVLYTRFCNCVVVSSWHCLYFFSSYFSTCKSKQYLDILRISVILSLLAMFVTSLIRGTLKTQKNLCHCKSKVLQMVPKLLSSMGICSACHHQYSIVWRSLRYSVTEEENF